MANAPPKQVLKGKYRLLRRLADAGAFEQYLGCTRDAPVRPVSVKRIPPSLARNKPTVTGFLEEARTTARLHHGSIARVLDVGEDGGTYVAVFEHLFGVDLDAVLEAQRAQRVAFPVAAAVHVVAAVLDALEYAHQAPGDDGAPLLLVHRDVSAKNVLAGYDGAVQLSGFGLAKHEERQSENTSYGVVRGQLAYVSPEQLRGQELDARSDLWAAAVLLYQLLTGALPFDRVGEFHILKAIREEPARPPSELRPELPAALDALFDRALAKDREARFSSAAELRAAIEAAAGKPSAGALADHLASLFASQLGAHLADAVAGKAGVAAVLAVVGGEVISEPEAPPSTERAPVPFEDSVVRSTEPVEAFPKGRPPEPSEPTLDSEPPRRTPPRQRAPDPDPPPRVERAPSVPAAPRPERAPSSPPAPRPSRKSVEAPREDPPPRPKPEPAPPPRPKPEAAPPPRQARSAPAPAARKKVRFRVVSERGLNPLAYPLALLVGALVALAASGTHASEAVLEPLQAPAQEWALAPAAKPVAAPPQPSTPQPPAPQPDAPVVPASELQLTREAVPISGTLRVDGPRGARIYVDRKLRGTAPAAIELAVGTHTLRIGSQRSAREETVRIDPGETLHRGHARSGKFVPPQPDVHTWP